MKREDLESNVREIVEHARYNSLVTGTVGRGAEKNIEYEAERIMAAVDQYTNQRVVEATEPLDRILEKYGTSKCGECSEYMHDDDMTICEFCDKQIHEWCAGTTYDGDGEYPAESAYAYCKQHSDPATIQANITNKEEE